LEPAPPYYKGRRDPKPTVLFIVGVLMLFLIARSHGMKNNPLAVVSQSLEDARGA